MIDGPVTIDGDAFGAALLRCHDTGGRPGTVFEIVERDDGWISVADIAAYLAPIEEWTDVERQLCERATGRVLDIGCGAGRHASALIDRGLDVIGIDPSSGAVAVCRQRGVRAVRGDACRPPAELGPFDTFLLLGWNLGLLGSTRNAASVFDALASVAAPGARILGIGADPHGSTDPDHLARLDANRERGRLPGQFRIRIRHERLATPFFDFLYCSPTELRGLTEGTPWRVTDVLSADPSGTYGAVLELRS
ncbi:class I SAM-dependent methyltransferase [Pseudonocardia sp. TRM90224]|uniref:class I SAM-dependent methyltransferase n=1 Tax=Pseudonocardia sp. TRM90224 TaxID=2812678 RepID=UPI001E283D75|nr:class I SAM-dependent methyltransferase [Pseudonocardia sp. TRM90224]